MDYITVFLSWSDAAFSTDIGPLLGGRIHNQLEKEVHPALDRALNMAGGTSAYFSFPLWLRYDHIMVGCKPISYSDLLGNIISYLKNEITGLSD